MAYFKGFRLSGLVAFWMIVATLVGLSPSQVQAGDKQDNEHHKKEFNAGQKIIDHIVDAYEWHILDIGDFHLSVPFPVILYDEGNWHVFMSSKFKHGYASYKGYEIAKEGNVKGKVIRKTADGAEVRPLDLSITKNVFSIFFASALIVFLFMSIAKAYKRTRKHAPKGVQSLLEPLILFIRDEIAITSIGRKNYEKFLPYLLTVFFFIFFNNLLGIVPIFPGGANVTGNIAVTAVLALFTFFITAIRANKNYWMHIFNTPGVPWWLKIPIPLMPIIELVGVFTKPFVLMVRLFANITAGHIIILGFISLIFVFGQNSIYAGYGISVISITLAIFIFFLELLVAFIQAYVFTLLSAIYFGMATEEHHHEEGHH
jgi:F-type H+-transporting ATPase subunit a